MPSSGFFTINDSNFKQDGFPGSQDEWLEDFPGMESTFVTSPVQLLETLPEVEPGFLTSQPASSIYPPAHGEHHSANFTTMFPGSPDANIPSDVHGWPLQTNPNSVRNYTSFFNPGDSGPMPAIMPTTPPIFIPQDSGPVPVTIPTTYQRPATVNAGHALTRNGFQASPYAIMNASSPIHDAVYSPPNHFVPPRSTAPSRYNGSPMFVDQTKPFNPAMGTAYQQIQLDIAGMALSSTSVPSDLAFQPIVPHFPPAKKPRRNTPYRTASLPVQAALPKEMVLHTCRWMGADGSTCRAQITWASIPKHLTSHGVKKMAHNHRVLCKWLGCHIRGDEDMMNRESIVRHIREKHLGYRRTL